MERPKFCRGIDCPMYETYCLLDGDIRKGWPSLEGRQRERERLAGLAEKDPLRVVSLCAGTGLVFENMTESVKSGTVLS